MRKLNKILIISLLTTVSVLNFSLADNSDCWPFGGMSFTQEWKSNWFSIITQSWNTDKNKYTNFLTIDEQNAIIDNESLNTAMLNLKKYCCENELWGLNQKSETCVKDRVFFNDNALDSPYLFDHIFDVIMRRLSGLTGDSDIYVHTNMTTDDKWTERRARINEKAENTWWATPQVIIDKYIEARKQSPVSLGYNVSSKIYAAFDKSDDEFLTFVSGQWSSQESKDVANAIKQYDQRTLYDRYINACAMSEYFYSLLHIWMQSNDGANTKNRVSNWVCHSAVQRQIEAENSYVKLVIQESSNLFLSNYIKWYMDYIREKSNTVKSKQTQIKNNFFDIVNGVPKLIKQCVH